LTRNKPSEPPAADMKALLDVLIAQARANRARFADLHRRSQQACAQQQRPFALVAVGWGAAHDTQSNRQYAAFTAVKPQSLAAYPMQMHEDWADARLLRVPHASRHACRRCKQACLPGAGHPLT
jgi:hypothetical protein